MPRIRYEVATGKINLIVDGDKVEETPVDGMKYARIEKYPEFDRTKETLYVKGDRIIAVDESRTPPLHRIIE